MLIYINLINISKILIDKFKETSLAGRFFLIFLIK